MNGITDLFSQQPQGQDPSQGQQPPPQAPQPQQAGTPQAMVGPLSQMNLQQLIQMMMNPRPDGPPLYAVISAISEQQKKAQAQAAVQRQMAMAQGQQAAQEPPVAQEVMAQAQQMQQQPQQPQQPTMAAQGGIMHGYAGGGAVAFGGGGRTYGYAPDYEEARRIGINLSPYDSKEIRQDKLRRLEEYRRTGIVPPPREAEPPEYRELGSSPEEMAGQSVLQRPRSQAIGLATPSLSATAEGIANIISGDRPRFYSEELYNSRGSGRGNIIPPYAASEEGRKLAERVTAPPAFDIRQPISQSVIDRLEYFAERETGKTKADLEAKIAELKLQLPQNRPVAEPSRSFESATQGPSVAPAPAQSSGILDGLVSAAQRRFDDRAKSIEARRTLPADVLEGRAGIASLMQRNLAAQEDEAKAFGEQARAARDAALARAQRSIFDDPAALLVLAGGIDTRKGEAIGSLARTASGLMGQRQAAAEAARKEYATAQQTERMLQANIRQGQMLEAQRVQAAKENEVNRVNQLDDLLNQNAAERERLERELQIKAIEEARLSRGVDAQVMQAEAAKKVANRPTELEEFLQNPEKVAEFYGAKNRPKIEGKGVLTYNEAADNVDKYIKTSVGIMEVMSIQEKAKKEGKPVPSSSDIRQMFIQREMQSANARPMSLMGSPTLPPGYKLDQ